MLGVGRGLMDRWTVSMLLFLVLHFQELNNIAFHCSIALVRLPVDQFCLTEVVKVLSEKSSVSPIVKPGQRLKVLIQYSVFSQQSVE